MSNFVLGYDNQADVALLSGGFWRSDLPLDNLKDYRVSLKARSIDNNPANTRLFFELPSPMHIGVVGLMGTNAVLSTLYRVTLYDSFSFTNAIYVSDVLPVYPEGTMGFGSVPWGAPNWWTAQPLPAEIDRFQNNVVHVLSNATWGQYGQIEIVNLDGPYFEAGRLFVGSSFQPDDNVSYGKVSLGLTSRSTVTRAKDGTHYWQAERADIGMAFGFDWLDQNEAMRGLDLQAIADIHGEVMAIQDPRDPRFAFRRQVFGRLKQLDPIQYPMFAAHALAFQVEGTL